MKIVRCFSYMLAGMLGAFPLVCLSSGIYKVEDKQGHVTYTNTQLTAAKRRDATRLNGGTSVSIITPRSVARIKPGNSAAMLRDGDVSSSTQQKYNNRIYPIPDQNFTVRSRQLGDSLRISENSAAPQGNTTRENSAHDPFSIDGDNIQVFDLKIKSF